MSTTLFDLKQVLVQQCGMVEANVRLLTDPLSPLEVGRVLAESAYQAHDVLLVCYVGHGLVSPGGELYLATKSTERRPDLLAYTALAYTAVRTSLLESAARSIVVILDCCFSGKAVGVLGALDSAVAVDLAYVNGGYVLTSAACEQLALAPLGARHTAFTGELIGLLTEGDPEGPPLLTLRYAYQYLHRVLPARGFPKPHRRASEWIDDLVLASNPAYRSPADTPIAQDAAEPATDACPYPGLSMFQVEDARWFFGRERVTTELVGRLAACLEQARPLMLVGASGSGKSSLLRAGLLPALSAGTLLALGSRTWPCLLFTPTSDPVSELAVQVAGLAGMDPHALRTELVANPGGFAASVRRALVTWAGGAQISGARVVLVVDQFEEIFLQCTEERDRRVVIRALCAAAGAGDDVSSGEPPALVILAVRADLYDHCAAYSELLPALQDGQVVLGPMCPAELRAAIEGPAHAAGLTLEPGLVEMLLNELGASNDHSRTASGASANSYDPGALPLLSHALRATWEDREGHTITVAGYQATGGIRGAIATTAEATFKGLDLAGQQAARRLLLRMVLIGASATETRLCVDRKAVIKHSPDPSAASAVFNAFIQARLITADEDTAEITHEALLRAWPRLRNWIDADRAGLYVHHQLTETAQRWDREGRPDAGLYRDTDLAVARDWSQEPHHHGDLGTLERDFLAASQALQDRQQQAFHRRAIRVRQLLIVFVVLLIGGIMLYQIDSIRSQPRPIQPPRGPVAVLAGHASSVTSVAFSPDGRTLASGSNDKTVRLWNVTDPARPTPLGQPLAAHTNSVNSVAFSPDGRTLASGSNDETVRLWNVTDPARPTPLGQPLPGTASVNSVAFNPDGHTLATSHGNTVRLWDVTDPTRPALLAQSLIGSTLAFSPDGHAIANSKDYFDETVQLWDVTITTSVRPLGQPLPGHAHRVNTAVFSHDGNTLATVSYDRKVRLWDLTQPTHPTLLGEFLIGGNKWITSMAFSPDGHILVRSCSAG